MLFKFRKKPTKLSVEYVGEHYYNVMITVYLRPTMFQCVDLSIHNTSSIKEMM